MIIGIDLGTTNSLAAYYTDQGPKIIPNRLGKNLTPSVVSIDENDQIYVGETAKERMLLAPESTAAVFKRDMGSKKEFRLLHKTFTAEELSSFVLRALKEDAESFLGCPVEEAVISVPTAAAVAYGLYQSKGDAKFLVFDLGGEDFTAVLENMFYEKFPAIDRLSLDAKTAGHIHKQAESCKIGFSGGRTSRMRCIVGEETYEMEVGLAQYEEACQPLLDRIRRPVKRSLSDAHIRLSDIDKVVLVGGATKSPVIRRFAGRLFKQLPASDINPDEAVALGAAIQGAIKERRESIREVILTDVCPFTLGTEVVREWEDGKFENGVFCPIIERNTVIPASRTERLYTVRDNQTKIRLHVLQGESRFAANNLSLGELFIDIPAAKAGDEAVDVTYTYDINSILEVEVKVVSTGKITKQMFLGREVDMTPEEIKERFEALSYLKIHPRDREENKYLLLKGERIYEESIGRERQIAETALRKFEYALNSYDQGKIERAKEEFKSFLEKWEDV